MQAPDNIPIDPAGSIQRFAAEIGGERLGLVVHRPEHWAKPLRCMENVLEKMERDGGCGLFGWIFHLRFAEGLGHYLLATHHAVWHSPDGVLIDVTPFHAEERHQPILERGDVLFLVHRSATPVQRGHVSAPLPLKFFAVTESEEMRAYVIHLTAAEEQKCQDALARVCNT
jgi:hypothetical protein